jgi:hypothetical protein
MIRKFLIIGKQLILSSTRFEIAREDGVPPPIEVKLPVEVLWEAQEILKKAEHQLSNGEDTATVKDTYEKLIKLLLPHCVLEKDRVWLYEQIKK